VLPDTEQREEVKVDAARGEADELSREARGGASVLRVCDLRKVKYRAMRWRPLISL